MALVFAIVPVLIYNQFQEADNEKQQLLLKAAQSQGVLIARSLQPVLESTGYDDLPELSEELARFADSDTRLKLLLRPVGVPDDDGFYYVAAAPLTSNTMLDFERQQLLEQGILHRLAQTCTWNQPLAIRVSNVDGETELLSSITPVNTATGCWAIVTSHSAHTYLGASVGKPYWRAPEVKAAAGIYLATLALVLLLFWSVWRHIRKFGYLARTISLGKRASGSFATRNKLPELNSVAEDFDRLVLTLRTSAENIRRAGEDNAHAFKTPIAVIRQSLEPLKRIVPENAVRGQRAINLIEQSLDRLDGLVSFARRMDETSADLLEPPRHKVNMSALIERMVGGYQNLLVERQLKLDLKVQPGMVVRGSEEMLETIVENLIENAISFSPQDTALSVRLTRTGQNVQFIVEDEGPGVDSANLERIFERYFSQRNLMPVKNTVNDTPHFGIGLWIVRRNMEAIGGTIKAINRMPTGLRMIAQLPVAR